MLPKYIALRSYIDAQNKETFYNIKTYKTEDAYLSNRERYDRMIKFKTEYFQHDGTNYIRIP